MKGKTVDELHREWMRNPAYRWEYEALAPEFELISSLIAARARSGLTQEEIAKRMGTTQSAVARLEGGGRLPSTRTLQRYAAATGSRLKITLEPAGALPAQDKGSPTRSEARTTT